LQCSYTFELLWQLHERDQQSLRVIRSVLSERRVTILLNSEAQLPVASQLRPESGQSHHWAKAADFHFSESVLPFVYRMVCKARIDLEALRLDQCLPDLAKIVAKPKPIGYTTILTWYRDFERTKASFPKTCEEKVRESGS
jgi:hypothetical protein